MASMSLQQVKYLDTILDALFHYQDPACQLIESERK
ncbi:hypothetical protein SAMN05192561_105131 [Halopenitus malekzadehii]|jgi:hypothetical protein|uniref:Uncharacterized protein n=1 Tax=Halopenitus malekzadehii TaxID=1267564 RepID=A0A1H6J536_9EURY|nr:hypothetical protein SAMN05192561_105131 [Halopenitus malekzadehii]